MENAAYSSSQAPPFLPVLNCSCYSLEIEESLQLTIASRPVASLLITGRLFFSSDFGPFSGFKNWSSQWLSIGPGKPRFLK